MKTLALIGSPRKQGNTDIMADKALSGSSDAGNVTKKIYLDDYNIRPIGEVDDRRSERVDTRKNDDFPAVFEAFLNYDIIIISSPVYWHGPTAQFRCFQDRISAYWGIEQYKNRMEGKGYIVLCAYQRHEKDYGFWVTEPIKLSVEALNGYYLGDVCAPKTYKKAQIKQYPDILEECYSIGFKAVEKLNELKVGD